MAGVIAEQLGVEKDKVTREATLSELGADSLDIVESVSLGRTGVAFGGFFWWEWPWS